MRLLHTSDWHFGQSFMNHSREREHTALIDWLLEQVQVQQVDAVLIAGDIFDHTLVSIAGAELVDRTVTTLL